jgi:hypothetical protein
MPAALRLAPGIVRGLSIVSTCIDNSHGEKTKKCCRHWTLKGASERDRRRRRCNPGNHKTGHRVNPYSPRPTVFLPLSGAAIERFAAGFGTTFAIQPGYLVCQIGVAYHGCANANWHTCGTNRRRWRPSRRPRRPLTSDEQGKAGGAQGLAISPASIAWGPRRFAQHTVEPERLHHLGRIVPRPET